MHQQEDENLRVSANQLCLGQCRMFQHTNNPKRTVKRVKTWLKTWLDMKCIYVLEWPSQSLDLNPIKNLWALLKSQVHDQRPQNMTELEAYCKEKWASIPHEMCKRYMTNYQKRLIEVIKNKGRAIDY